jgi:hypothetical protein
MPIGALAKLGRPFLKSGVGYRGTQAVGAGLGGAYGWNQNPQDPAGERALDAAGYGVMGGMAVPGLVRAGALGALKGAGAKDAVTNTLYYSYLSSPDTIARANFGAIGGMLMHGLEEALTGVIRGDTKQIGNATKLLKGVNKARQTWFDVMIETDPQKISQMRRAVLGDEYRFEVGEEFRDIGLGKWYTAGDLAAVTALKASGISTREALRFTLTGTPQTQMMQDLVGLQSRWLREGGYAQRVTAGIAMPFARVGAVGLEQGVQRIPVAGMLAQQGMLGKGLQATGEDALVKSMVRQLEGVAAMGTGAFMQSPEWQGIASDMTGLNINIDPRIGYLLGTLAGPAYLPFAMGREGMKALQSSPEQDLTSQLGAFGAGSLSGLSELSPLGQSPLNFLERPWDELSRRFVPSGIGDVAEAIDPAFGRVASSTDLRRLAQQGLTPEYQRHRGVGTIMSQIPGLREQLPEQYAPVGPEGQPRLPHPETLGSLADNPLIRGASRTMLPARQSAMPPVKSFLMNPEEQFLHRMGINRQAPTARGNFMGMPFRPSASGAAQMQQLRGLGPQAARQMLASGPFRAQMEALRRTNPMLAQMMMQQLYQRITQGIGAATGPLANLVGLQGSRQPFGGFGGG